MLMNRVVYFEIHVPDPQKAMAFYAKNFGWSFMKSDLGPFDYWMISTGEKAKPGIDGGLMQSQDGQPRTVNTLEVDDLDAMMNHVNETGGQIVVPKMPVAGIGWLAYATDPGGNIFGMYKNDPNAK
jgi:hypothetical protein